MDFSSIIGFGLYMLGYEIILYNDFFVLEEVLQDDNVVGFMVELIQGEVGVVVFDEGYLCKVYDFCCFCNVLFIVDEV